MRPFLSLTLPLAITLSAGAARGFELDFSGPGEFAGKPASVHEGSYVAILRRSAADEAVSRWTVHVGCAGGRITALSVEGTDADAALDGGSVWSWIHPSGELGFSVVELPPGVTLPGEPVVTLLRLSVECTIPEGGKFLWLNYPLTGSSEGEPPGHPITAGGIEVEPVTHRFTASLVDTTCESEDVTLGVSLREIHDEHPFAGIAGGVSGRADLRFLVPERGEYVYRLFVNIVSGFPPDNAIEAWTLAVLTEGSLRVVDARSIGLALEAEQSGGFRREEVIDLPTGLVRFLVKSEVNLRGAQPSSLPPAGTESVLSIDLVGRAGDQAAISFRENPWGYGGANTFFPRDFLRAACNQTSAQVFVRFEAGGVSTFHRGDSNADGRLDMSDAITTLGALFLGQGRPTCLDAADFNDDGGVDISDAVGTLALLFLGRGEISLPDAGACGPDPTSDDLTCEDFPPCR